MMCNVIDEVCILLSQQQKLLLSDRVLQLVAVSKLGQDMLPPLLIASY
jgi:hypothetical protein